VASTREFDVVVLGAGPAGEVCAGRLAAQGMSVAIVERELVGGECSFYACIPSKALLRPAQVLAEARRVPGAAQAATGELSVEAVLDRRDEVTHGRDDAAQLPWLRERGVTLVRGGGRLSAEREVQVAGELLRARRAVVLASGSSAAVPPIAGLAQAAPWGNREATAASRIPASLLVLGGGVVGVEMACAYASLGSRVSVIEAAERLIAGEEEFASRQLHESLERQGVAVALGAKARAVRRPEPGGPVTVELEGDRETTGDELLVTVGRRALSDELGLESVGLQGGGPVEVLDSLQVRGHDWLYAIGDVNGRALLTHMGKYQARIVADAILGRRRELRSDGRLSPRVIFTEPQIAAVGHTLAGAREEDLEVRAVDAEFGDTAGSSYVGHGAPGSARLVIDERRRVIVGATFTGVEVAESLHAATIALIGEVPVERLWHAVPCFPTRSEIWLKLLEAYER
jgi:pyruvate/2-oxoglutarate dehydrogenase complex dihydrolipoamide dehydrogenase (E3) component